MPLVSLVSAFILGLKNASLKFLYPVLFGALGIIISAFIFMGTWDLISIVFSLVPALIGLVIGIFVNDKKFQQPSNNVSKIQSK